MNEAKPTLYHFYFDEGELSVDKPIHAGQYIKVSDYEKLQIRINEQRKEFVICEQQCFKQQKLINKLKEENIS